MSSTIWKSRPSSPANARHGACSSRGSAGRPERAHRPRPRRARRSSARCSSVEVARRPRGRAAGRRSSRASRRRARARPRASRVVEREPERLGRAARRRRGSRSPRRTAPTRSARRAARVSLSSAGRSSWTSENECTSSTAAAAGRRCSARAPTASPVARQSTGRTRLPPSAWRIGSSSVPSSGVERELAEVAPRRARRQLVRRPVASAASRLGLGGRLARCSSASISLRELGELLQDLDRLVGVVGRLEPRARLPRAARAAPRPCFSDSFALSSCASSRWIRPRMPLTSLRGVVGRVALRERDGLVDRDLGGHLAACRARGSRRGARCARRRRAGRRSSPRTRR